MKNLISIAKHSDWLESYYSNPIEKWDLHLRRVEFGKQPLEIWQFVPCKLVDGVWVILEEPLQSDSKYKCINIKNEEDFDIRQWTIDFVEYQEAKDRVLFEGFESIKRKDYFVIQQNGHDVWVSWNESKTVEDILWTNAELTPTAKKQIGL